MGNDNNATVSINLHEGSIVISGSEEFVGATMQVAFDFLERNLSVAPKTLNISEESPSEDISAENAPADLGIMNSTTIGTLTDDKYIRAGVYHIDSDDGTISILKKVPGESKSEKAKNIALIALYIKKGKIPGKDIIPICEKHACYDSSNFSAVFKNEKTNIVRKGSGQSWTIELTQPGETAARALLEAMANEKK